MNPLVDLPQILTGELGRSTGMFLAWFWDSNAKFSSKLRHTQLNSENFPAINKWLRNSVLLIFCLARNPSLILRQLAASESDFQFSNGKMRISQLLISLKRGL